MNIVVCDNKEESERRSEMKRICRMIASIQLYLIGKRFSRKWEKS